MKENNSRNTQVAVRADESPMPRYLAPGMAAKQGQSTCTGGRFMFLVASKSLTRRVKIYANDVYDVAIADHGWIPEYQ
jgi:hypothetical protein